MTDDGLSILIPTYNTICVELVRSLQAQAESLPALRYEIIVADDGSDNLACIEENKAINDISPYCHYIIRGKNVGRASIRNFLAQQARYGWLLFIDSDMVVRHGDFLKRYIQHTTHPIVYGGYQIREETPELSHNLRYIFEKKNPQNGMYKLRKKNPYKDFHTSNFMVARKLMIRHPLDERFLHYGYEDVAWGKMLQEQAIEIFHIDNPTSMETFEDNAHFLSKTEEGLRTLYQFRNELSGYSNILKVAGGKKEKILRWKIIASLIHYIYILLRQPIKERLEGNKPSIFLFNVYKLMYFLSEEQ